MKKLFLIIFLVLSVSFSVRSQVDFIIRLTNGYIDKNPAFTTKNITNYGLYNFEFLTFERWTFSNTSNICVLKMGTTSPLDSIIYLTQNGTINKNPSIAYNLYDISKAMVVWQSYINGRWDIYGSAYLQGIWSPPFPVDTSNGNKNKPCVVYIENSTLPLFCIAYQKDNDIIFKRFDAASKQTLYENNLTSTDTSVCRNPALTKSYQQDSRYYVCYEKQKPDGNFAIYYRYSGGYPYSWSNPDTLSYIGNNRNVKAISFVDLMESFSYESNRTGKWGIYQSYWTYSNGWRFVQSQISVSQSSDYLNYVSFFYPYITDAAALYNAALNKSSDSSNIKFSYGLGFSNPLLIPLGDSSRTPVLTMGNGIFIYNPFASLRVWLVYNKDSAGYSMLYALGARYIFTAIKNISSEIPTAFSLSQNYPNPFNSMTKIRFAIPFCHSGEGRNPLVRITVFDILGKEVATLVNEPLQPGTYETTFDASNLSSGIYFYKLQTKNFSETKNMTLLK